MEHRDILVEVASLRTEVDELRTELGARRVRGERSTRLLFGAIALLGLAVTTGVVANGLFTFGPNTPAVASQVNHNFELLQSVDVANLATLEAVDTTLRSADTQLRGWIEQKVGTVGTADVRVTGITTLDKGLMLDCNSCGSTSTLNGADNWGDMIIQGRVMSASANLHLSPPGGSYVIINDSYRAAGGLTTGGAGLIVEANIIADNNTRGTCAWTGWFSEEQSAYLCPSERFVAGMDCSGSYCDSVRLYCCEL